MSKGVTYLSPNTIVPIYNKRDYPDIGSNSQSLGLLQTQVDAVKTGADALNVLLAPIGGIITYDISSTTITTGTPLSYIPPLAPLFVIGGIYLVFINLSMTSTSPISQISVTTNQTSATMTNIVGSSSSVTLSVSFSFTCQSTVPLFTFNAVAVSGTATLTGVTGSTFSIIRIK